jgi:hypothetical protein
MFNTIKEEYPHPLLNGETFDSIICINPNFPNHFEPLVDLYTYMADNYDYNLLAFLLEKRYFENIELEFGTVVDTIALDISKDNHEQINMVGLLADYGHEVHNENYPNMHDLDLIQRLIKKYNEENFTFSSKPAC